MIGMLVGLLLIMFATIIVVGGLAYAGVALWEIVFGPGEDDPYDQR